MRILRISLERSIYCQNICRELHRLPNHFLFENDASSARPEGSMRVIKVIWWKHNCKSGQYSSAMVHRTLTVNQDGTYVLNNLDGLKPEEIDGF